MRRELKVIYLLSTIGETKMVYAAKQIFGAVRNIKREHDNICFILNHNIR